MHDETSLKIIASLIKQTRIEKNMSIEELSSKSELPKYKIEKIESGDYDFTIKEFNKLKKILNIKLTLERKVKD